MTDEIVVPLSVIRKALASVLNAADNPDACELVDDDYYTEQGRQNGLEEAVEIIRAELGIKEP